MACIPESRLDHLSKIMASSASRRDMFRYAGVTGLAMALSTIGLKTAEAAKKCAKNCPECLGQVACEKKDCTSCGCIRLMKNGELQEKCFCHEFVLCDGLVPCVNSKDCKQAGLKGYKCGVSCCGGGSGGAGGVASFCHPKCGRGPTCSAGAPVTIGSGLTSGG